MFYQGEPIRIAGTIAVAECSYWKDVINLSGFAITILISDPDGRQQLKYSTESPEHPIERIEGAYSLVIPGSVTAGMLGEYQVEVAISVGEDAVLSDNKAKMFVHRSRLGEQL